MNTDKETQDRQHTIGVLQRQSNFSRDAEEKDILAKAAEILRKRNEALTRGPSDSGGPVNETKTR